MMENQRNMAQQQQSHMKGLEGGQLQQGGQQQRGAAGGGRAPAQGGQGGPQGANSQGQYKVGGGAALGSQGPHVPPAYAPQVTQTSNMYSQLETMMMQVKNEAKSLEAVKSKIKEMDGLRVTVGELKETLARADEKNSQMQQALADSETVGAQLRQDMQRLNDIYSSEHTKYDQSQQVVMKLEQDISNAVSEMGFYQKEAQKIPELRKKSSALQTQIGTMQKQATEEKTIMQQVSNSLEQKLQNAAKEKAEQTSHFWNLTEENKQLQKSLIDRDQASAGSDQQIAALTEQAQCARDQGQMIAEDQLSFLVKERSEVIKVEAELQAAQAEADSIRALLESKSDQELVLSAKLRSIEEARASEKGEVKGRIAALTETVNALKTKNHELEREASEATHRVGLMGGDVSRYTMEVEHLQAELSRTEVTKQQSEAEHRRSLDGHIKERDDAVEKLQKATTQFDAMQSQARDGQARYWEELQRVKEAEAQLTEEADALASELEEKGAKLIAAEAERAKLEEYVRAEVSGAMTMTSTLRTELERRLEELTATRKERDESVGDKKKFEEAVEEMKKMMERQEVTFKRTLDTDRNKISGEIKAKMQKLRGLEIEKQELLQETTQLMKQVETTQKQLTTAQTQMQDAVKEAKEAHARIGELEDVKVTLDKEKRVAEQTSDELREHANRLEGSFKEDITRLDNLVKESKKAAAQQVLDISDRVKSANEETDQYRHMASQAEEHEKKAVQESETAKAEREIAVKQHEEMQQQMAKDMTTMRRELQDMRNKQKISAESRTQMEKETMAARLEATKAETEVNKVTEWCKELDLKMNKSSEELRAVKGERSELDKDYKKLKMKAVELEENLTKKAAAHERMTKDMAKLEREGLVETRRMRVQLQAAEAELGEVKPMVQLLQKELSDGKSSFQRMQGSTNDTVNGLLQELKETEDALSQERRSRSKADEAHEYKVRELSKNLERAKEHIEENVNRTKQSSSEKELRVLQLEQDLERIKTMATKQENRVDELEKQHQADRTRIHELKENIDSAERSVMDAKTTLELEQAQRRRVEARLKVAESSAQVLTPQSQSHKTGGGASGASMNNINLTPTNTGGPHMGGMGVGETPSSIEVRTRMLYGDVNDMDETEQEGGYDNDMLSRYQLDNESAMAAIGASPSTSPNREDTSTQESKSNSISKKAKKIISSGIAGDDDDFMAETASNPALKQTQSQHPGRLELSSDGDNSSADGGMSAVDRMTQALAARAAAESAKSDMRKQSQQRQEQRRQEQGQEEGSSGRPGSHSSKVREMVGSASADHIQDRSFDGKRQGQGQGQEEDEEGGVSSAEESIQRTQMFLRQRLANRTNAGKGSSAGSAGAAQDEISARAAYGDGEETRNSNSKSNSAEQAAREAQELAAKAYERQRGAGKGGSGSVKNGKGAGVQYEDDEEEEEEEGSGMQLKPPRLSPKHPAPMNSINGYRDAAAFDPASPQGVQLPSIQKKR